MTEIQSSLAIDGYHASRALQADFAEDSLESPVHAAMQEMKHLVGRSLRRGEDLSPSIAARLLTRREIFSAVIDPSTDEGVHIEDIARELCTPGKLQGIPSAILKRWVSHYSLAAEGARFSIAHSLIWDQDNSVAVGGSPGLGPLSWVPDEVNDYALVVSQPKLPLAEQFSPSRELIGFWIESTELYAKQARGVDPSVLLARGSNFAVPHEFTEILLGTVSKVAQQLSFEDNVDPVITEGGRFRLLWQIEFCNEFLMAMDLGKPFLDMLSSELRSAVAAGAEIAGDWGTVRANVEGDLYLHLVPGAIFLDPEFVHADP